MSSEHRDHGPVYSVRARQIRTDARRMGEIIVHHTHVTQAEVDEALKRCRETGLSIGEQLFKDGKLTEEERAKCLSAQWGIPFLDLQGSRISRTAIHLLDQEFQRERRALAAQLKNNVLTVAIVDPLDLEVIDEIRVITGYDVKPVIVTETALKEKFRELFEPGYAASRDLDSGEPSLTPEEPPDTPADTVDSALQDAQAEMKMDVLAQVEQADDVHELNSMAEQMPIIRMVDSLLAQGIQRGASDIHLQAEGDCLQTRYRVDGILRDGPKVPRNLTKVVVARVKVMANMDIGTRRSPQDGRVTLRAGGRVFELRVSVLPCVRGPKVVLRIAEQGGQMIGLDKLGFDEKVLTSLRTLIHRPNGIILITGPTGSGKSTTLYSAIAELNTRERNILTVEDPVELQLRGISQAEINEKAGLTFASCLRAALRQDPNIIMVGEIRDTETAAIATQASLTGHLVLSTLHTNDAASAVTRLVDMGIEPYLVGSSLIGVLAQRLARKICERCAVSYEPEVKELEFLGLQAAEGDHLALRQGAGCEHCLGSGYKGRLGVFELLIVSDPMKHLIVEGKGDTFIRKQAVDEGMITLVDDVSAKLRAGLTTIEEAHRVVFF